MQATVLEGVAESWTGATWGARRRGRIRTTKDALKRMGRFDSEAAMLDALTLGGSGRGESGRQRERQR
jgi:hypothetical protein